MNLEYPVGVGLLFSQTVGFEPTLLDGIFFFNKIAFISYGLRKKNDFQTDKTHNGIQGKQEFP